MKRVHVKCKCLNCGARIPLGIVHNCPIVAQYYSGDSDAALRAFFFLFNGSC